MIKKRQPRSGPTPFCKHEGCTRKVNDSTSYYCKNHFQGCAAKGCTDPRVNNSKFCRDHAPPPPFGTTWASQYRHAKVVAEQEWVLRWKRSSHLRDEVLPTLNRAQESKCASYLKTCDTVNNGASTGFCPWGDRRVPHSMQQVDHITPFCLTQDDSIENLQMLCACCHAHKSDLERRATIARITNVSVNLIPQ